MSVRRGEMASESQVTLQMKRQFSVRPERVFDAWLDPNCMKRWLFTTSGSNKVCTNHSVVGGTWEIVDHRDGKDYRAIGKYLEIEEPKKIVFTFQMPQFSESVDKIKVELKEVESGCEMIFTQFINIPHEIGWEAEDMEKEKKSYKEQSKHGWNLMFISLEQQVARDK